MNSQAEFIRIAFRQARFEVLSDDGTHYGDIPICKGVYANAETLEGCRRELREVLEEWTIFRLQRNLPLPDIRAFRS